jgi:hypothetical protein
MYKNGRSENIQTSRKQTMVVMSVDFIKKHIIQLKGKG